MGTHAHQHQVFRFESTRFVLGEVGLIGFCGIWITQVGFVGSQLGDHGFRTPNDVDGLTTPLHFHQFAYLQLADVGLNRPTQCLGAGARAPRSQKWNGCSHCAYRTYSRGGYQQEMPPPPINLISFCAHPKLRKITMPRLPGLNSASQAEPQDDKDSRNCTLYTYRASPLEAPDRSRKIISVILLSGNALADLSLWALTHRQPARYPSSTYKTA